MNKEKFIPTEKVSKEAEKGLKLREKFGRGGTDVGIARAKQLLEKKELNLSDVKKMYSYFARHNIDKRAKNFGDENNPSNGYIAWLLWGGEAGKEWVEKIMEKSKDS